MADKNREGFYDRAVMGLSVSKCSDNIDKDFLLPSPN